MAEAASKNCAGGVLLAASTMSMAEGRLLLLSPRRWQRICRTNGFDTSVCIARSPSASSHQ